MKTQTKKDKKPEVPKEPTIEEKLKQVLEFYGQFNRHTRRMWGKFLGIPIPGLSIPHRKGKYSTLPARVKQSAVCKNEGCESLRANGSSRCGECSEKYNG